MTTVYSPKAAATLKPGPAPLDIPLDADRIIDDAFITPKVLDRRAFEELSSTLKQLVRDAAAKGQSLQTTATEVRSLGDSLREATKQLHTRLEAALKVAPALDQRLAKAEQVVQLVVDRSKLTEHLEQSIAQIIDTRLAEFTRRLTAMTAEQEDRLHAAAARATEDIEARRQRLQAEAEAACERVAQSRARLAIDAEGFEQLIRSQVDAAAERLAEPVRQADRRAAELASRLEEHIQSAEDRLRAAREQADVKLAGIIDTASRHAETVTRRAQEDVATVDLRLRELIDQAAARLTSARGQSDQLDLEVHEKIRGRFAALEAQAQKIQTDSHGTLLEVAAHLESKVELARHQLDDAARAALSGIQDQTKQQAEQALLACVEQSSQQLNQAGQAAADATIATGAEIATRLVELGRGSAESIDRARHQLKNQLENVTAAAAVIDARLENCRKSGESLGNALSDRMELITRQLSQTTSPGLKKLEGLLASAERLAGAGPDAAAGTDQGTLPALLERAASMGQDLSAMLARLSQLRSEADLSRRMLGDAILTATASLDKVHRAPPPRGPVTP